MKQLKMFSSDIKKAKEDLKEYILIINCSLLLSPNIPLSMHKSYRDAAIKKYLRVGI